MGKLTDEMKRLKEFIENNFDFKTMKQIGFFPKDMKRTDYEAIAKRVCTFFGFETIYEYEELIIDHETATTVNGHFISKVGKDGNLISGEGFHLDICETEFECPICTCKQDAEDHAKYRNAKWPVVTINCKGCKRKLNLLTDMGGNLTVSENTNKNGKD